jgi:cobalt/nickel transport system permease protein
VTQIPLAVSEGLLTVLVVRLLTRVSPAELARLGIRPAHQEA